MLGYAKRFGCISKSAGGTYSLRNAELEICRPSIPGGHRSSSPVVRILPWSLGGSGAIWGPLKAKDEHAMASLKYPNKQHFICAVYSAMMKKNPQAINIPKSFGH